MAVHHVDLHGSLPQGRYPPPDKLTSGEAFVWMDRYLDTTPNGPMYLKQESIAKLVVAALHRGVALKHYDLQAYIVMSNHVHALLLPKISPSRLMQSLKGATAREANKILGRTGEPFWQTESYDHWVRDDAQRAKIQKYIENNPVKASIVQRPEDYLGQAPPPRGSSRDSTRQTRVSAPRQIGANFFPG